MNIKLLEQKGACSFNFEVTLLLKELQKQFATLAEQYRQTYSLPGFRKGKVPMILIEKNKGNDILQEAVNQLMKQSVDTICKEHNIDQLYKAPLYNIKKAPEDINVTSLKNADEKESMTIEITIEKQPDIPSIKLDDLKGEIYKIDITEQDYEEAKKRMLEGTIIFADAKTKAYAAAHDDKVFIAITKDQTKEYILNDHFKNREEKIYKALLGSKAGDKIAIASDEKEKVEITKIQSPRKTKKFDKAFFETVQVKDEKEYKDKITDYLINANRNLLETYNKKKIFDILDQQYDFDVPDSAMHKEINMLKDIASSEARSQESEEQNMDEKSNKDNSEDAKKSKKIAKNTKNDDLNAQNIDRYTKIAKRRIKISFLIQQYAKEQGIDISKEEFQQSVMQYFISNPSLIDKMQEISKNNHFLQYIRTSILENKVVINLLQSKSIKEKSISLEKLIKDAQEENNTI